MDKRIDKQDSVLEEVGYTLLFILALTFVLICFIIRVAIIVPVKILLERMGRMNNIFSRFVLWTGKIMNCDYWPTIQFTFDAVLLLFLLFFFV